MARRWDAKWEVISARALRSARAVNGELDVEPGAEIDPRVTTPEHLGMAGELVTSLC